MLQYIKLHHDLANPNSLPQKQREVLEQRLNLILDNMTDDQRATIKDCLEHEYIAGVIDGRNS